MPRYVVVFLILAGMLALPLACGKTEHLQGKSLYLEHCANCHFEEGQGLRQLMPPLAGADYLRDRPADVVRGIRHGMQGPMEVNGVLYNAEMPANKELSDFQIVNIMNYINQAWGNDYGNVTVQEVRTWLGE
ncbi:cbb3-type cytochrome c oxidase subunit III [Neolewinella xylanilytica]|uniref:Cbb3-type cytochrome c oxidase subunit III n=1 Tax=Neolewinella xylanilytica TaxID=1514080 RepID=A0A2S6I5J8_9BACT|nr:cytochrome c [Neolewinella xylanilytica]PPK86443.1 cbb3-type cytochrome c oxidase subunit III [Neolewinella xylanilytica]